MTVRWSEHGNSTKYAKNVVQNAKTQGLQGSLHRADDTDHWSADVEVQTLKPLRCTDKATAQAMPGGAVLTIGLVPTSTPSINEAHLIWNMGECTEQGRRGWGGAASAITSPESP